jgi:hypothetical protein
LRILDFSACFSAFWRTSMLIVAWKVEWELRCTVSEFAAVRLEIDEHCLGIPFHLNLFCWICRLFLSFDNNYVIMSWKVVWELWHTVRKFAAHLEIDRYWEFQIFCSCFLCPLIVMLCWSLHYVGCVRIAVNCLRIWYAFGNWSTDVVWEFRRNLFYSSIVFVFFDDLKIRVFGECDEPVWIGLLGSGRRRRGLPDRRSSSLPAYFVT